MNFWVTIYKASWVILGILALVLCFSLFTPQIKQYRKNQRDKAALEEQIRIEEQVVSHLKRQQERLQYDPEFVERIAREEFGMARPNETVFRFSDEDKE